MLCGKPGSHGKGNPNTQVDAALKQSAYTNTHNLKLNCIDTGTATADLNYCLIEF